MDLMIIRNDIKAPIRKPFTKSTNSIKYVNYIITLLRIIISSLVYLTSCKDFKPVKNKILSYGVIL